MSPAAPRPAPLRGAILVGGGSRRMGRAKSWIELDGRSFAARVAAAVAGAARDACFVGAGELPPDAPPLDRLADVADLAGPLAGILAALRRHPRSAWLVAACDLPLASPAAARWLAAQRRRDRIAILPRLGPERVEPLFAIYEPAARALLERLAAANERSLQALAREAGVATPSPPAALRDAWRNVNTPEELRALRPSPRERVS